MAEIKTDLGAWFTRVQKGASVKEVLEILDEFRRLDWSDNDRAAMAKVYLRVLEKVSSATPAEGASSELAETSDGPVWYEKM